MGGAVGAEDPASPRRPWGTWLTEVSGPVYAGLFALAAAFAVAPIWAGDVLPFQDYAGNMSYAAILAGAADPGSLYARTYVTGGLLVPNGLLFYSWAWLGPLLGFVAAGKVLLTVYALGLPLAADRLLLAAGRDRRFALLAFPLVYNSSLMMGFASFATSLPLAVYALARGFRFHANPTPWNGVLVAVLASLTFIGHVHMYLLLGVMVLALLAFLPRTLSEALRLALPYAASLVVFLPWAWENFVSPPDPSALGGGDFRPRWQHPAVLWSRVHEYAFARWSASFDDWVLFAFLGVVALGVACRRASPSPPRGRAGFALEGVSSALFLSYLLVPEHTAIQADIASRSVAPALLVGLGWLDMPRARFARPALAAFMVAMTVVFGAHAARAVRAFDREEMGPRWIEMIDRLPEGSRLAVFTEDDSTDYVRVLAHQHVYGYHYGLNGGLAFTNFHRFYGRHATWRRGQEVPWPGDDLRAFLRGKTACWYDFLLARTVDPPHFTRLEERVTYMDTSARYTLWKIEHDRMPACRSEPSPPAVSSLRLPAADLAAEPVLRPLSTTLSPEVGHARGRDLRGDWAPSERARFRTLLEPVPRPVGPAFETP